eukprot:m.1037542 g.1037542  ORF g.1037542 m.1037542 type:complete len:579 (-) comp24145_c0_seq1:269-2005(-)
MGGSDSKVALGPAKRWNWGILSTQIAEEALLQPNTNPGDFLVRRSRKLDALCISVRTGKTTVQHFPVLEDTTGYFILQTEWHNGQKFQFVNAAKGTGMGAKKFSSMQDLLQFLMGGGKGGKAAFNHFGCFLLRALPKVEFAPETLTLSASKGQRRSKKASSRRAKSDIGTIPPDFSPARRPSKSNSINGKLDMALDGTEDGGGPLRPRSSFRRPMSLVDEEDDGSTPPTVPSAAARASLASNTHMRRRGATSFASGDRSRYVNAVMGMKGVVAIDDGQETFGFNAVDLGNRDRAGTLPGQRIIHDQQTYDQERKERARLRRLQQMCSNSDVGASGDDGGDNELPAGKSSYVNMAPGGAAAANTDASVVDGQVPCRRGYVNIKLKDATSPAPNSNAASHEYEYQNAFDAPLNERTYATTRNCLGSESTSPSNSDRTTSTVPSDHTGDTEEIDAYQYTQMLHRPTPTQSDAVDLPYGSFGEHLAPLNEGSPAVASTSTYVLETQLASANISDNDDGDDGESITGWSSSDGGIPPGTEKQPGTIVSTGSLPTALGRDSAESDDSALQWYGDPDPADDDGAC